MIDIKYTFCYNPANLGVTMNKHKSLENIKKHIQKVRKDSPTLNEREVRIALGQVIMDIKGAQKKDKDILKTLFSL